MTTTKVIRLKRWKIQIRRPCCYPPHIYTVIAVDELDARLLTLCLDGVFSMLGRTELTNEDVINAQKCTKILEVSNA